MDNNPYAHQTTQDAYFEPARTSIAAVLGFVASLIGCCLPIGIIGVLLGILGLVGIGRSNGRVGGKGLAIAAIIIGLLNTMLWIGGAIGMVGGMGVYGTQVIQPTGTLFADIEAGNYDAARGAMMGAGTAIPDEQFARFVEAYQADAGAFVSVPTKAGEIMSAWMSVGQIMAPVQGRNDIIPMPATFQNGQGLILLIFDPANPPPGAPKGEDLAVVSHTMKMFTLSDYADGSDAPPVAGEPEPEPDPEP